MPTLLPRKRSRLWAMAILTMLVAIADPALAWPERPVRLVTPSAAGSGGDIVARTLAEQFSKRWRQPVVVENRPGADGFLAVEALTASRDGHSLLVGTHSLVTVNPLLHEKLPYDPVRDLAPISLLYDDFLAIFASPTLGLKTLADAAGALRAEPGKLNYATVAGSPYLAMLGFLKENGLDAVFVSYRNANMALPDLAEGRLQLALLPLAIAKGSVLDGKLKMLAVTNTARSPAFADVPTVAEAGFPGLTFGGLIGMFGTKEMNTELRERVAADARRALEEPATKDRLAALGIAVRGTTPGEFAAVLDEQRAKWAKIAAAHGVRPTQ